MTLTPEQIHAACQWWADAVSTPKFDNGDPSEHGQLTRALAERLVRPVGDPQRGIFIATLARLLSEGRARFLDVDYGPDETLALAMRAAGISLNNAPWKTSMTFYDGGVQVRHGYTGPLQWLDQPGIPEGGPDAPEYPA